MPNSDLKLMRHILKILRFVGINPFENTKSQMLLAYFVLFNNLLLLALMITDRVKSWTGIYSLGIAAILPSWMVSATKLATLIWNIKKVKRAMSSLNSLWPTSKFENIIGASITAIYTRARWGINAFFSFCLISVFFSFMVPLLSKQRITIFPSYLLCNLENDICYIGYYIWQAYTILSLIPGALGFDSVFAVLIIYAYCGLEIVKQGFKQSNMASFINEISESGESKDARTKKYWRELIDQHNTIFDIIKQIKEFVDFILVLQFITTVGCVVFLAYIVTNEQPFLGPLTLRYISLGAVMEMQTLIYCFSGALIYEQTISVGDAAYGMEWYLNEQSIFRTDLAFIIQRSQRGSKLTLGNVYALNLYLFVVSLKNSYSVFICVNALSK